MEGTEFINYFAKIPVILPYFKGVFSIDTMPKSLKNKCFFVTNLSPHTLPGTHWIAFLCLQNILEIFCSLGNTWDLILPHLKLKKIFLFITMKLLFKVQILLNAANMSFIS